jgi:hypothetical protein
VSTTSIFSGTDTDPGKRASSDRQASATNSASVLGFFSPKAHKTVSFFVSFHQGTTHAGIEFIVRPKRQN